MKKFSQFLESRTEKLKIEQDIEAMLEEDFDFGKIGHWYLTEGKYLNEEGMFQGLKNFAMGAANKVGQGLSNMGQNYTPGQGLMQNAKNFTQGFQQGGQNQQVNMKMQKAQAAIRNLQDISTDMQNSKLLDGGNSNNFMKLVAQVSDTLNNVYNKQNLQQQQPQQQVQQNQAQPQAQQQPQQQQVQPQQQQQMQQQNTMPPVKPRRPMAPANP